MTADVPPTQSAQFEGYVYIMTSRVSAVLLREKSTNIRIFESTNLDRKLYHATDHPVHISNYKQTYIHTYKPTTSVLYIRFCPAFPWWHMNKILRFSPFISIAAFLMQSAQVGGGTCAHVSQTEAVGEESAVKWLHESCSQDRVSCGGWHVACDIQWHTNVSVRTGTPMLLSL
jgi:hypothetical protein